MDRTSRALPPGVAPPQRFEVDDLVVRRWDPTDLIPRVGAVNASFSAIHPWMSWLPEPTTIERQRGFSEGPNAGWPDSEGSYNYGIFDADDAVLGSIGLHDHLGDRALEIGYWCHIDHAGRGIITRATSALTDIALALPGIDRVEIHCDEANVRSAAVPRRLGYRLDRVGPRPIRAPAGSGVGMIWIKQSDA